MVYRILFAVLLLISVSVFPAIVTIVLGVIGLIVFKNFYELVPLFFVHDAVYGISQNRFFGIPFVMTLTALILVVVTGIIRKRLFYVPTSPKI